MTTFYTNVEALGGKIVYRGIENGVRVKRRLDYRPTLFVPAKAESKYTSVTGEPLERMDFTSISDAREFVQQYSSVPNFGIYGQQRYEYCYISDNFREDIEWSSDLIRIANIDIEVDSESGFPEPDVAKEVITAITVKMDGIFNVFSTVEYTPHLPNVKYTRCENETDMLMKFVTWWTENYPDIITGWNIVFFDIPYLVNRIVRILGEQYAKMLSPWNAIRLTTKEFGKMSGETYIITGIATWDYQHLFKKYTKGGWSHESYTLNAIAFDVLGKKKLDYSDYDNLRKLYRENPQLFIEYNITDVALVDEIDEKEKVIDLCLTMAYDAKVNYEDVFSQVRMWDVIIYNKLRESKMVMSPMSSHSKDEKYAGAYVKEPITGMHEWVASFDLTSLYPHLIMQFNISPDTLISPKDYTPKLNEILRVNDINVDKLVFTRNPSLSDMLSSEYVTLTPNRQFFTLKKHGFLPEIMQTMFNDRKRYKKEMLAAEKERESLKEELKKRGINK
jgi:DNA polymerase elongation subunit (family B)